MNSNKNHCALTDIIEGPGLTYWAESRRVRRDPKTGYVTSCEIRDHGPDGERTSEIWTKINGTVLSAAAMLLLTGAVPARRDLAAQFIGPEWEYDSEGLDVLVQAACFNEVRFG